MVGLMGNVPKYWEFIRKLRNHPMSKKGFVEQSDITEDEQIEYMQKHNDDYYVCVQDGRAVGFIGAVDGDIRLAVDPLWKGLGIGEYMLNSFMCRHPHTHAKILKDNTPSIRLFEKCGFSLHSDDDEFYYYSYDIQISKAQSL